MIEKILKNHELSIYFYEATQRLAIADSEGLSGLYAWQTDYENSMVEQWNSVDEIVLSPFFNYEYIDPRIFIEWHNPMPPDHALLLVEICNQVIDALTPARHAHYFHELIYSAARYWTAFTGRSSKTIYSAIPCSIEFDANNAELLSDEETEFSYVHKYICSLLDQCDPIVSNEQSQPHWPTYNQVVERLKALSKKRVNMTP